MNTSRPAGKPAAATAPSTGIASPVAATALIAEDEPLLAEALADDLQALWPGLRIVARARDGRQAVALALEHLPDVLWLDIRMPAMDGLEVAEAVLADWPQERCWPLIVFVTAYDEHALAAFEQHAVDYVLKPWQAERLQRTCARLQVLLAGQQVQVDGAAGQPALATGTGTALNAMAPAGALAADASTTSDAPWVHRWPALQAQWPGHAPPGSGPPLRTIAAGEGQALHFIPVEDVVCFEAADKYVQVVSRQGRHWIRMSLKELLARLPAGDFLQIHRSVVIRADALRQVQRDDAGRCWAHVDGLEQPLQVSRLHAQQFKAM